MTIKYLTLTAMTLSMMYSCKKEPVGKTNGNPIDSSFQIKPNKLNKNEEAMQLDLDQIPETDKLQGTFPYIKLPIGYHFFENPKSPLGYGEIKDYDKEFLINHGVYFSEEGKTFKCGIGADDNKTFSELELEKSFDDFIANIGGLKLYGGEGFKKGEYERMNKLDPDFVNSPYKYSISDIIEGKKLYTYVIHTRGQLVFVQMSVHNNDAELTVLETRPFKNTMELTSAETIKSDIDEKGKSILHINFDTDKSTLQPEGMTAVKEILKVLQSEPNLKLYINGYTDNTGDATHNKQLSSARAKAVKNTLVQSGIAASRLNAIGYGADNPLLPNTSEKNKAQNRRVELVKM